MTLREFLCGTLQLKKQTAKVTKCEKYTQWKIENVLA